LNFTKVKRFAENKPIKITKKLEGKNGMNQVVSKIEALCQKKINYSQIFELAYQTSTKLKTNEIHEFNSTVHNILAEKDEKSTKRFSAGIRHTLWVENFLYNLYKQKKNLEIKKLIQFYEDFEPKNNIDDITLFNIFRIYKFISGNRTLPLDFKKLEILFKKPQEEYYTYLYLIWKSLEIIHASVKENLENYSSNSEILSGLENCVKFLELGLSWDKILKKEKFSRLETESYSYLKKTKATIAQLSGNSNASEDLLQEPIKLFNEAVKLFNEQKYSQATENLKKSTILFQKQSCDDPKMKSKIEKCFALLGKVYYVQDLFDDASSSFLNAIYFSNIEEDKYSFYIDQFVRSKMKGNKKNITIISLSNKLSKEILGLLIEEELKAYQSLSFQSKLSTSNEQLEILNYLLSEIYSPNSPEHCVKTLEREKILINLNYDKNVIQNAIETCNRCIENLDNKNYDELALTYSLREMFKLHYHILNMKEKLFNWKEWNEDDSSSEVCEKILKLMKTKYEFKYFKSSIKIWNSLLQQCSSNSIGKYIKDMDRSFNQVELMSEILDYYGETETQLDALNLMKAFNGLRGESNGIIDIKLAKLYIDLGYVNLAESLLAEIDEEEEEEVLFFANITKGYLLLEKGNLKESHSLLSLMQTKCKGNTELLSLCRYYLSQVNFYQNDPESLDSSLVSLSGRMKKLSITSISEEFVGSGFDNLDYGSILTSLLQVGNFYESRGSVNESFYFYNQGLLLATLTFSPQHVTQFLMSFGGMEQRKHKFMNSKIYLSTAYRLNESNTSNISIARIQDVSNLIQLSDVYRIYQRFEDSKKFLNEASSRLNNWKHPSMDANEKMEGSKIQSLKAHISLSQHLLDEQSSILQFNSDQTQIVPTEEAMIHQFLAQKYKQSEEPDLAKDLYSKIFGLTGFMIPTFARSSLSSLAELSQTDPYLSSYLSSNYFVN
jgi:hypothetical protein